MEQLISETQDTNLRPVLLSGDDFRGHPVRSAHHRRPLRLFWTYLSAKSKIS